MGDVLSIAPMMEWTDCHYRFFMRLLTRRTTLFTEMYVANTLLHSPHARGFLRFSPEEHPIVCQLGGSDPEALAKAARIVEEMGYDEVNLNCGCPSPRVAGKGAFGAALMFSPEIVRDCVVAMKAAVRIPITVKCRLGADDMDSYEAFSNFVRVVSSGGCQHFIVHARKCLLKGLDPKGNRTIPPLRYPWVQRIALENPTLSFSINGGLVSWRQVEQLLCLLRPPSGELGDIEGGEDSDVLEYVQNTREPTHPQAPVGENLEEKVAASSNEACDIDCSGGGGASSTGCGEGLGEEPPREKKKTLDAQLAPLPESQFLSRGLVRGNPSPGNYGGPQSVLSSCMIGRAAYGNPWMFANADRRIFGVPNPGLSRREVLAAYLVYAESLPGRLPEEEQSWTAHRPFSLAKPLISLFQGEKGGGSFRRTLSQCLQERKMGLRESLGEAVKSLPDEVLDARFE